VLSKELTAPLRVKWQAYGYKNMEYFKLKIMQKVGYLNSRFALQWKYDPESN
jgi:hypothetical protein